MCDRKKHPFFENLKEVTKKISDDIKSIKEEMKDPPSKNPDAGALCNELMSNIQKVKKDSTKLTEKVFPELSKSRNYSYDIEDLVLELDEETVGLETHLGKYGYKHISREYPIVKPPTPVAESNKSRSVTPTFAIYEDKVVQELSTKKAEEDSDLTPVLQLDKIEDLKIKEEGSDPLPLPQADSRYLKFKGIIRKLEDDF